MTTSALPDHLLPVEEERELLAGAFRAALLADEGSASGRRALSLVAALDPADFVQGEHRSILTAMRTLLGSKGTLSPALVKDELRRTKSWDALRVLPATVNYGLAPVRAMRAHVHTIRTAAAARARYHELADQQARILHDDEGRQPGDPAE